MGRMDNKVAIVTGASSGIGTAELELLAQEGARVVATGRNEERLNQVVSQVNAKLGSERVVGVTQDIADEGDWARVVAAAVEAFGRLDVLVNNAAIPDKMRTVAWDFGIEEAELILRTNTLGVLLGIRAAMPELKKSGSASIVNISSAAGLVGGVAGGSAAYAASKAAVGGLSREIALNVAKDGVRVNTIYPGLIMTPILQKVPKERTAFVVGKIPVGFAGDPMDIAHGVVYLASDESRFVTGADLVIDGGYTAQ